VTDEADTPIVAHAAAIAAEFAGAPVARVARFTTGLAHYVYDVDCVDGRRLVVRMGRPNDNATFEAAEYWSELLRPMGVPLPHLYKCGEHLGLPYLVLERLPGRDLQDEYANLSTAEKHSLAQQIVEIQRVIGALPAGTGYGFARRLDGPFSAPTWPAFLRQLLDRSRRQIAAADIVDSGVADRIEQQLQRHHDQLMRVAPTPFLDDVTTKNVIIDNGRLSGIVDVDVVCFGDPLLTIALTRMALLSANRSTDYVEAWCDLLTLSDDQRNALRLYTAVHCVGFLSEHGNAFNQDTQPIADAKQLTRLYRILDELLAPA